MLNLIAGLQILSKYTTDDCCAEHDIIYFYVNEEDLPEDSEDGQKLQELGFHLDENGWAYFC